MNLATFNAVRTKFIAAYDAVNGAGSAEALPPGTLMAILMALLQALQAGGCLPPIPTPAEVKTAIAASEHQLWLTFMVHRELVTQLGRAAARKVDAGKSLAAAKAAIADCDDVTLQGVIDSNNL